MRSFTKFSRLRTFGKKLPAPRKQLHKDLRRIIYDRAQVVALVSLLMDQSFIRVGNKEYAKKNKSYDLTTLDKHVVVSGAELNLSLIGKKGVPHDVTLRDVRFSGWCVNTRKFPASPCFSTIRPMGSATLSNRGR